MAARLTILTGPARSGKTDRLLDEYRKALRTLPPGGGLWIAPTYRAGQRVVERLIDGGLEACFAPGVATFAQFAQRVLDNSSRRIRPLSPQARRTLVRWLIDREHAAGRLPWFGRIADTPGLVDLVAGWISELKRLEIWPEEFRRCAGRRMAAKDRDLLSLYTAYQETLLKHDLYDAEGRFWSARDLLTSGQLRPLEALQLVVLDGFADFTRPQLEILQVLLARGQRMFISLPLEPGTRCDDLFAKSQATLEQLRRLAKDDVEVVVETTPTQPFEKLRASGPRWPAMEHLEANLFRPASEVARRPGIDGIEIIAAMQERGEVEQIARRIKRLLTDGDELLPGLNVKPCEIAVVVRSLETYAALIRETFAEFGIPTALESGRRLSESSVVAAMVNLLRLHARDWPYRTLLAVLGNNFFRPNWREARGDAAASAAQLVRELQVPSGRRGLLAAASNALVQVESCSPVNEAALRANSAALALLERLATRLDELPAAAIMAEWAAALEALAADIKLLDERDPNETGDDFARERAAWKMVIDGLHESARLFRSMEEPQDRLSTDDLLRWLEDLLQHERLPREADDAGRVRVLSATSVRALDVPYLFFAGLSERSFPAPESTSRPHTEPEIERLRSAGLPLPSRHDRGHEEMLLFYEVITRATRRLWLSYPALDHRAEPLLASPFVKEVQALFAEGSLKPADIADVSPIPAEQEPPRCPRELRVKGVAQALEGDGRLLASTQALARKDKGDGPEEPSYGALRNILSGLTVIADRASGRGFGAFEGIVASELAVAALAERFGAERAWSATDLESYGYCPYRFFLQRVLGIEPQAQLALETDYLERGSLLHDVLARLHRRLQNPTAGTAAEPAELRTMVDEVIAEVFPADASRAPLAAALRETDRRALVNWLRGYEEQLAQTEQGQEAFESPLQPAYFEAEFGRAVGSSEAAEGTLGQGQPVELTWRGRSLRIAGRIDRIDIGRVGGQDVFRLIDYKSGRKRDRRDDQVEPDGTRLQLELYALAAQRLLPAAIPWDAGYWHVQLDGYKPWQQFAALDEGAAAEAEEWASRRELVLRKVFSIVAGVQAGEFPMQSADEHCTGRCPFRTVCRVNQVRALEKEWTPPRTNA